MGASAASFRLPTTQVTAMLLRCNFNQEYPLRDVMFHRRKNALFLCVPHSFLESIGAVAACICRDFCATVCWAVHSMYVAEVCQPCIGAVHSSKSWVVYVVHYSREEWVVSPRPPCPLPSFSESLQCEWSAPGGARGSRERCWSCLHSALPPLRSKCAEGKTKSIPSFSDCHAGSRLIGKDPRARFWGSRDD